MLKVEFLTADLCKANLRMYTLELDQRTLGETMKPTPSLAFHLVALNIQEKYNPARGPLLEGIQWWKFHESCWKNTPTIQTDTKVLNEKLNRICKDEYFQNLKMVYIPADVNYTPKPKDR